MFTHLHGKTNLLPECAGVRWPRFYSHHWYYSHTLHSTSDLQSLPLCIIQMTSSGAFTFIQFQIQASVLPSLLNASNTLTPSLSLVNPGMMLTWWAEHLMSIFRVHGMHNKKFELPTLGSASFCQPFNCGNYTCCRFVIVCSSCNGFNQIYYAVFGTYRWQCINYSFCQPLNCGNYLCSKSNSLENRSTSMTLKVDPHVTHKLPLNFQTAKW